MALFAVIIGISSNSTVVHFQRFPLQRIFHLQFMISVMHSPSSLHLKTSFSCSECIVHRAVSWSINQVAYIVVVRYGQRSSQKYVAYIDTTIIPIVQYNTMQTQRQSPPCRTLPQRLTSRVITHASTFSPTSTKPSVPTQTNKPNSPTSHAGTSPSQSLALPHSNRTRTRPLTILDLVDRQSAAPSTVPQIA